jgi:hypothetical protein
MRSRRNIVIISPRRFGRTSLALAALDELDLRRVAWAHVDLLRAPAVKRLVDIVAGALYAGLISPLERTWQRLAP